MDGLYENRRSVLKCNVVLKTEEEMDENGMIALKTYHLQLLPVRTAQVCSTASRSLPPAHFNLTICILYLSKIFSNAYLKSTL